jgi:hypothetical protein
MVVAAGCGGDDGGGAAAHDFLVASGDLGCTRLYECCSAGEAMQQWPSQEKCASTIRGFSELASLFLSDSLSNHRVVFHADLADACLNMLRDETCDQWKRGENESTCNAVFEAKVAPGGACMTDSDCRSGQCGSNSQDGVCIALSGVGGPCTFDSDCTPGLTCPLAGSSCVAQANRGERCTFDSDCLNGLYCQFGSPDSICADPLPTGSPCGGDSDCVSQRCVADPGGGSSTCSADLACPGV